MGAGPSQEQSTPEASGEELLYQWKVARRKKIALGMLALVALPAVFLWVEFYQLTNPIWGALPAGPRRGQIPASAVGLRRHVERLARIPRRASNPGAMDEAARYIARTWEAMGLRPRYQRFRADGHRYANVTVSLGPRQGSRLVVGAHYDVYKRQPGADDNASGVAGMLELTRLLVKLRPKLSAPVELVAYALEEPPYFGTRHMGSAHHARALRRRGAPIKAMLCLEMIGFFTDRPHSQRYTSYLADLFYPSRGDFIAIISNQTAPGRRLTGHLKRYMRAASKLRALSVNSSRMLGVDFSDHRNYWAAGYPAAMISDTAFLRNPHYHKPSDTPQTLDYARMSEVVRGLYWALVHFP